MNGFRADWGQIVSLQVEVDDIQDEFVSDGRILWTGSQNGTFASGRWVQIDQLPVGENVLQMTATNSLGASATAAVTVFIGDMLVPPGPVLSVAPQTIAWHVAGDDLSTQVATLSIGNAGGGALSFDVSSDASWLLLDSTLTVTGAVAPRVFTVTALPALLPAGRTSKASLTFASLADPNHVVVVPVELSRGNVFDHTGEPQAVCAGDCDGSDTVRIDELIRGVNIALERIPTDQCAAFDINADGRLNVNELVSGVIAALNGC